MMQYTVQDLTDRAVDLLQDVHFDPEKIRRCLGEQCLALAEEPGRLTSDERELGRAVGEALLQLHANADTAQLRVQLESAMTKREQESDAVVPALYGVYSFAESLRAAESQTDRLWSGAVFSAIDAWERMGYARQTLHARLSDFALGLSIAVEPDSVG